MEGSIFTGMYTRGISTRDIQDTLTELYGIAVSASLISKVTDKVLAQLEIPGRALGQECQNRLLDAIHPIIYLDSSIS
jgi:transposase-like protein